MLFRSDSVQTTQLKTTNDIGINTNTNTVDVATNTINNTVDQGINTINKVYVDKAVDNADLVNNHISDLTDQINVLNMYLQDANNEKGNLIIENANLQNQLDANNTDYSGGPVTPNQIIDMNNNNELANNIRQLETTNQELNNTIDNANVIIDIKNRAIDNLNTQVTDLGNRLIEQTANHNVVVNNHTNTIQRLNDNIVHLQNELARADVLNFDIILEPDRFGLDVIDHTTKLLAATGATSLTAMAVGLLYYAATRYFGF